MNTQTVNSVYHILNKPDEFSTRYQTNDIQTPNPSNSQQPNTIKNSKQSQQQQQLQQFHTNLGNETHQNQTTTQGTHNQINQARDNSIRQTQAVVFTSGGNTIQLNTSTTPMESQIQSKN